MVWRRRIWLGVALIVLGLGAGAAGSGAQPAKAGQAAPEIATGRWINSAPLTIGGLGGRVVLLEFWAFG